MSLERIKMYIGETVFCFWCNLVNDKNIPYQQKIEIIKNAIKTIKQEKETTAKNAELILLNYFLS